MLDVALVLGLAVIVTFPVTKIKPK